MAKVRLRTSISGQKKHGADPAKQKDSRDAERAVQEVLSCGLSGTELFLSPCDHRCLSF